MASDEKAKNLSVVEKFTQWFRTSQERTGAPLPHNMPTLTLSHNGAEGNAIRPKIAELPADKVKDISSVNSNEKRMKAIKDLTELVASNRLPDLSVELLVSQTIDVLNTMSWLTRSLKSDFSTNPPTASASYELRLTVWKFYKNLIQGQQERLYLMRAIFFYLIKYYPESYTEDMLPRLELLKTLTENGKNIQYFEEEVGYFMLTWFSDMAPASQSSDLNLVVPFLKVLVNIIKYNASYLDQETVSGLVRKTCYLMKQTKSREELTQSLNVFDVVLCYSYLPPDVLNPFTLAICKVVQVEGYGEVCWKIMRNLLGTHLGHSVIKNMCVLLQDQINHSDICLLRGAVHFIGKSLWGEHRVSSLKHKPDAVLPALAAAIECKHPVVVLEVTIAVYFLVSKEGQNLPMFTWAALLDICDLLVTNFDITIQAKDVTKINELPEKVHTLLTYIENIQELNKFCNSDKLFDVLEKCSTTRPDTSVFRLIDYRVTESIDPSKENWINSLVKLMENYFVKEKRSSIREKALDVLSKALKANRYTHQDSLIDNVVLHYLGHIADDADCDVRRKGVQLLVDLVKDCKSSKRLEKLLEIFKKVLKRPFDIHREVNLHDPEETIFVMSEDEVIDAMAAVDGLISIFKSKLYFSPGSCAVEAFNLLVTHLNAHYKETFACEQISSAIKQKIFTFLLSIRANSLGQICLSDDAIPQKFSPFLCCSFSPTVGSIGSNMPGSLSPTLSGSLQSQNSAASPPPTPSSASSTAITCTPIYLSEMFTSVFACLEFERNWPVLVMVLEKLRYLLTNKAVVTLSCNRSVVNRLTALCDILVNERSTRVATDLTNIPAQFNQANFKKSDLVSKFQSYVFPVLETLIIYSKEIEPDKQNKLVKTLKVGLSSRQCNRQCILALTVCVMEMQDTMNRMLPDVILNLSKISATKNLSIPKLEFLSNLILFPRLYASFISDQYMSIFAIALPYTNPFEFEEYTIALAHRVIAMWFLKCRLPFRKQFVEFIIKGLQANIMDPKEQFGGENRKIRAGSINADTAQNVATAPGHKKPPDLVRVSTPTYAPVILNPHHVPLPSSPAPLTPTPTSLSSAFSFPSAEEAQPPPPKQTHAASEILRKELIEACMDLLARYTFGMCSSVPQKSPIVDFLLDRSHSCTWLMDQKLVTITTSNCGSRAFVDSLCEKCYRLCKSVESPHISCMNPEVEQIISPPAHKSVGSDSESEYLSSTETTDRQFASHRRRHQSAINHKPSPGLSTIRSRAYDDLCSEAPFSKAIPLGNGNDTNLCSCWCQGWAEIMVRRPTGNTSWIMRVQNSLNMPSLSSSPPTVPFPDLLSIYNPMIQDQLRRPTSSTTSTSASITVNKSLEIPVASSRLPSDETSDRQQGESPLVFRRTSSSPEIERGPLIDEGSVEAGPLPSESKEGVSSRGEIKLTRAASLGRGDTPSPSPPAIARASSFSRKSPSKLVKPDLLPLEPVKRRDTFSGQKTKMKLELSEVSDISSGHESFSGPSSPTKSISSTSQMKTPPKPSPKLDDISEHSSNNPHIGHRDRSSTISVMSPAQKMRKPAGPTGAANNSSDRGLTKSTGLSPCFVFLQLFYNNSGTCNPNKEKPLLLPKTDVIDRAVRCLDHITPYETHKIGVVYVGVDQSEDKTAILANKFGSARYMQLLKNMGTLIRLKDVDPLTCYVGGLTQDGQDGKFAYSWQDNLTQVIFHVSTLMPTRERDPNCNDKKRHIGNDFVCIVYNDSGKEFSRATLKGDGQYTYACIVITPLEFNSNKVEVQVETEMIDSIGHKEPLLLSDQALPLYVRQLGLHAHLGSTIFQSRLQGRPGPAGPYVSNWVERLRQVKRIKKKIIEHNNTTSSMNAPGAAFGGAPTVKVRSMSGSSNTLTEGNPLLDDANPGDKPFTFPEDFTEYV